MSIFPCGAVEWFAIFIVAVVSVIVVSLFNVGWVWIVLVATAVLAGGVTFCFILPFFNH